MRQGSPKNQLSGGDVVQVSEGTLVASLSMIVVYWIHQRVDLPLEIEGAVVVLIYAGVRFLLAYLQDTTARGTKEVDDDGPESDGGSGAV